MKQKNNPKAQAQRKHCEIHCCSGSPERPGGTSCNWAPTQSASVGLPNHSCTSGPLGELWQALGALILMRSLSWEPLISFYSFTLLEGLDPTCSLPTCTGGSSLFFICSFSSWNPAQGQWERMPALSGSCCGSLTMLWNRRSCDAWKCRHGVGKRTWRKVSSAPQGTLGTLSCLAHSFGSVKQRWQNNP